MITALARIIGLPLLGRLIDQLPPRVAAAMRLLVVLATFGSPLLLLRAGRITYSDAWFWLWLDAFVVGVWTIVTLVARQRSSFERTFFVVHYFLMFTLLPGVLYAWLYTPVLPLSGSWATLLVLGAASLVVHGWLTRGLWWGPGLPRAVRRLGAPRGFAGFEFSSLRVYVLPYLRLAVVYAGLFLPLSIEGARAGTAAAQLNAAQLDAAQVVRAGTWLLGLKLALELSLAVGDLWRAVRPRRPGP